MQRSADDFTAIGARLREIREEKARALADADLEEIKAQVEQDLTPPPSANTMVPVPVINCNVDE